MSDTPPPPAATPPDPPAHDITPVTIEEEMRRSYLDYAMSVIVARALPDVRDGLKPVHRRILYAMKEAGYEAGKPHRKSARVVGDVMGKYHPHGDAAIYDAMVRMAQPFSMGLMLIDGQGNFGSMDGDPPAAMRYTEVRLAAAANELLDDIDKDTVDFQPNYDETAREPVVLPARFPNLLVNGAGGIAVGMATNIPPHNLGEVVDACVALIDNPAVTAEELMELLPAPDFPTGGIIMGRIGAAAAFRNGRGPVIVRARSHVETIRKDREAIVVTEIPYQVNKARLVEAIAELVREKRIDGVSDLRDESDRDGVRVVIELKRDAMAEVVLNQLYRYTQLQISFGVNMLALNKGRPEMMTLKDVLARFLEFREVVITRRTVFELGKARERAHILVGLAIAVANIDQVIALIRAAPDPASARAKLMERRWPAVAVAPLVKLVDEPGFEVAKDGTCRLSEAQARGILDLRLQRLTALERDKLAEEVGELGKRIADFLDILGSRARKLAILKDELAQVRERFAVPRRTEISEEETDVDIEDLIHPEDMVVTVSHAGYIKRVPLSAYRSQRRGGKGRTAMSTREEDFVREVFVANTHAPVLFFSSRGMVYKLKVYTLPEGTPQARGKAMVNLLPLAADETISTVMPLPVDEEAWKGLNVMFATARGNIRRNALSDFTRVFANGKIAMKLGPGDRLVGVQTCGEGKDVLLSTRLGKCIRFAVAEVRVFAGRTSTGVRGIRLAKGDEVISMSILDHVEAATVGERDAYVRQSNALRRGEAPPEPPLPPARFQEMAAGEQFILGVTENGFGKRTSAYEYRITGRGGQGIVNIDTGARNGNVVASFPVGAADQVMMVTDGGQLIRFPVDDIRIAGRGTQGVTLFRLAEGERVTSVSRLDLDANGDDDAGGGGDGGAGRAGRRGNGAGEDAEEAAGEAPGQAEEDG